MLGRPRFAIAMPAARRARILEVLRGEAVWFSPAEHVSRDQALAPKRAAMRVHGHQQLSLFNAHHDAAQTAPRLRCAASCRPTFTMRPPRVRPRVLLRPGRTPSGHEVRSRARRLVRRIRQHWPNTRLTIRGDGHCGRPEGMAWCEANAVDCVFGLPGNAVLSRLLEEEAADDVRVRRAEAQAPVLRRHAEVRHGAKPWGCERRVSARIEASIMGSTSAAW